MAPDGEIPTKREVARTFLATAKIDSLRREVRRNSGWAPVTKGFRADSLTRAVFVRFEQLFARNDTLLADLCRVFLDSQGVPAGNDLNKRFGVAAGYKHLDDDVRLVCAWLEVAEITELAPEPETPQAADDQVVEEPEPETPAADDQVVEEPEPETPAADDQVVEEPEPETPQAADDQVVEEPEPETPQAATVRVTERPSRPVEPVELDWEDPADEVSEAQKALTLFERSLCALIARQLRDLHGDGWLRKGCGGLRSNWRAKAAEFEPRSQSLAPETLLGYAELADLRQIIIDRNNWRAFEPYFGDQEEFKRRFQEILPLRIGSYHPGQRSIYMVAEVSALNAMAMLSAKYHPETADRIDEIFRQVADPTGAPTTETTAPAGHRIASNLGDFSLPRLIGREAELRHLSEFWDDDFRTVTSIIGEGGVGKTALLDEFVSHLLIRPISADKRPDPEVIIYLTAKDNYLSYMKRTPSREFKTLSRIYEVALETAGGDDPSLDVENQRRRLLSLARDTRILFALDNLETLDDREYEEIGSFLDDLPPPSKAIITTRIDRRLGRHKVELEGLPHDDAVEFLTGRLLEQGIEAHEEDCEALDEIASYTRGVPLALVHCTNAIVNGRGIRETLEAIKGREFLELLEFSFESSLAELAKGGREGLQVLLFLALSKHPRTRQEIARVISDDGMLDETLNVLVKKLSFAKPSWEQKKKMRYLVDGPLLRDYVKKRAPEELDAEQYALVLRSADVLPADAESPSVSVEIERAIKEAKSMDWREAIGVLETARKTWGEDGALLAELGYFYYRLMNRPRARSILEKALSLGHESADTYFHLALVLFYEGLFDEALPHATAAINLRANFPYAETLSGQILLGKVIRDQLLLDDAVRQGLFERALGHLHLGLIPDERGRNQEAHNARTRDAMQHVDQQLEKIRSARSRAV